MASRDLKPVFNALRRLVRAARLSANEVHGAIGVSGSALFVLQQIAEHPGASMRDLTKRTHTDHSSVSVVVARLVRRRLVARKTSPADARRVELSLTPKGHALLKDAPEALQERLVRALDALKAEELRTLGSLLERVVRTAGIDPGPAEMFHEPMR